LDRSRKAIFMATLAGHFQPRVKYCAGFALAFAEVTLRTEAEHDTDHGDNKAVAKKKMKHGEVFQKYSGTSSPAAASPARFPILQLSLLKAIRMDLQSLRIQMP